MKTKLPLALALVFGLLLGAFFSPLRYNFVPVSGMPCIFRCDRLTGRVVFSPALGQRWHRVGEPKPLAELTDDELRALDVSVPAPAKP